MNSLPGVYKLLKGKWVPPVDPKESFEGQNVIVTGSNTGIGFEAAVKFSALGASRLILAVRDAKKGEAAKAKIEARTSKKGQIEVWQLDMDSYQSIQSFADHVSKEFDHLDVALLNAGVNKAAYSVSPNGWEETLQVNTLSTFLLALLLLPKLKQTRAITGKPAVLEFTNSGLHQTIHISEEHKQASNILQSYNNGDNYDAQQRYCLSKLFLMFATRKLASQIDSKDIIVASVCPGACATDLARDYSSLPLRVGKTILFTTFFRSAEAGSRTLVSGATLGDKIHGRFWQHDVIQPVAETLTGEENEKIGEKVWNEIVAVLSKEVPAVTELSKFS